jgi:endonuclease YncB( thermonuclease family)
MEALHDRRALPALAVVLTAIVIAVAVGRGTNTPEPAGRLAVIDGDTVQQDGVTYRLIGFDAPERGDRALCDRERELGEVAATRLRELIAGGIAKLEQVACPCASGTEGTPACNAGRSCANLKVGDADVGPTLVREGLARPYVCTATSCPARPGWC